MNTAPETNFFGYRIVDNATAKQAENVTASFMYRGYEVAFATFLPAGQKPVVLRSHVFVGEYGSVEAALAAIDEMLDWRGAGNVTGRQAAVRHGGRH